VRRFAVPEGPAQACFAGLLSRQRGTVVDRNVYWLSTQPDVVRGARCRRM
jgi:hypothetical protein